MHRVVAVVLGLAVLAGCGGHGTPSAQGAFCVSMGKASGLLARNAGSHTPQANKARYQELRTLLDQAQKASPPELATDVATFASAIDHFDTALAASGYDLDALFATPEGTKLAEDTSHALTPAVVKHMTGPCAIKLDS